MATADSLAALAREFELELLHLKQMLALLEAERRELAAGGTARLDAISAERLMQANALELYAARRGALLEAQGFSADASGLAACAAAAGRRGRALAAGWQLVAETAAEVRDCNAQNQALMRLWLAAAAEPSAAPRRAEAEAAAGPDAPLTPDQALRALFSGCAR
jgi:flagellar biosynthesis/type III secretory pathway chaperone